MLAATPPFALSALKYGLLVLLFLFIWRSMRWVVRGLNVDRTPAGAAIAGAPAADSPARPSMLMLVSSDGQKPHSVRLDGSTTIGRSVECELRLDDTYVSQQHARIFDRSGNWYVEDKQPSVHNSGTSQYDAIQGHPMVCARIASGNHQLVKDANGTYVTGNCMPVKST